MIDLHVQGRQGRAAAGQGRAGWKLVAMCFPSLLPSPLPLPLSPKVPFLWWPVEFVGPRRPIIQAGLPWLPGSQGTPRSKQKREGERKAEETNGREPGRPANATTTAEPDGSDRLFLPRPHPRDGLGQSVDELAVMKHPGDPSLCFSDERSPKWGRPGRLPKRGLPQCPNLSSQQAPGEVS